MFEPGVKVVTVEHPDAVGEVKRVTEDGALVIEFVTQPSKFLPFGSVNLELWPMADHHLLMLVD